MYNILASIRFSESFYESKHIQQHMTLWFMRGVSSWGGRNWMEWWRMILAPIRCLMMDRLSPSSDCSQTPTQGENSRIKIWIFWRWNESSAIESRPISHKTKDKVYLKISPRGGRLEHLSKGHTFDDSSWMRKIFDLIVAQIWSYSPQLRLARLELMCQRPLLFQHVFHLSQLAHSCQHSNKRH